MKKKVLKTCLIVLTLVLTVFAFSACGSIFGKRNGPKAQVETYTVTWRNFDGSVLKVDHVATGNMPSYTGETPERENDDHGIFTFKGWSPELRPVTANVSYRAQYSYTVTVPSFFFEYTNDFRSYAIVGINANSFTEIVIPSVHNKLPVTEISENAFNGCNKIEHLEIPETITKIGEDAFYSCNGLTEVKYSGTIDGWAQIDFANLYSNPVCYSKKLYVGDEIVSSVRLTSATKINSYSFYDCENLTSVSIPKELTYIGKDAFASCENLSAVYYGGNIDEWVILDGLSNLMNHGTTDKQLYFDGELVTKVNLTVKNNKINASAFRGCGCITEVTVSDDLSSDGIGKDVFADCDGITSVTLPVFAFQYVPKTNLQKVVFTSGGSIGSNMFANCSALTDVVIPNGVTDVSDSAFSGCNRIKNATLPALALPYIPKTDLQKVVVTSGDSIGDETFCECSALTEIYFPDSMRRIGSKAFFNCTNLTVINIPDGVTDIADDAYYGCNKIADATLSVYALPYIPKTGLKKVVVTSGDGIGREAFRDCAALTEITIPDSVKSIGSQAFDGCNGLTKVNYLGTIDEWAEIDFADASANPISMAKGLYINGKPLTKLAIAAETVNGYAFYNCTSATEVVIADTVTGIGEQAFGACANITDINVSKNVTSIDAKAFDGCNGIINAAIPTSVIPCINKTNVKTLVIQGGESIGDSAFLSCANLESITLCDSVKSIGSQAFSSCTKLTDIAMGNGVTDIGAKAFEKCTSLAGIDIPDSVKSIGEKAFDGCNGLTKVNYLGTIDKWAEIDFADALANPATVTKNLTLDGKTLTKVNVVNATKVGGYAFYGFDFLTEVVIGDTVTSIGEQAFGACANITDINVGKNVTSVDAKAFDGCNGIINAAIPTSVIPCINKTNVKTLVIQGGESIGEQAFLSCAKLESITLCDSVKSIGSQAFDGCNGLTEVNYLGTIDKWAEIDFADASANPATVTKNLTLDGKILTKVNVVNATKVGGYAFYGFDFLTEVVIGDTVTSIGKQAFGACANITDINVGKNVTSVDAKAFDGCNGIINATIPTSAASAISKENLKTLVVQGGDCLEDYVFYGAPKLESLTLGDTVGFIGYSAFHDCKALKNVTISAGIETVRPYAFDGCTSITMVNFLGTIEEWVQNGFGSVGSNPATLAHALYINGELVTKVNVRNATEVVRFAFYGNNYVTEVVIGDSVKSIGIYAFCGCPKLTSLTISNSVETIGDNAFNKSNGITTATMPVSALTHVSKTNLKTLAITDGERIESDSLSSCVNLESITLCDSIKSIGEKAFSDCGKLTAIEVGESVTSIAKGAFSGCSSLQEMTIPFVGNRAGVTKDDGDQYPFGYIFGNESYPGSTKYLQNYYYTILPNNKTSDVFYIPDSLRSVTVTGGHILPYAFNNIGNLPSVTLGDNVMSIDEDAFNNCFGLTSLTLGKSVTEVDGYAFRSCVDLVSMQVDGNSETYKSIDGNLYSKDGKTLVMYAPGKHGFFTVPKDVTSIGDYSFFERYSLTGIDMGENVTSIGYMAFQDCYNLVSVTIPAGVTSIGDYAFRFCYKLVEVHNLSALEITKGSEANGYIGSNALNVYTSTSGESKLSDINGYIMYNDADTHYLVAYSGADTQLTLPTTTYGYNLYKYAFYECDRLTSITMSDSVTGIGEYAFYNCDGLASVTTSNNLTSVGQYAFYECRGLRSIRIPDRVKSIGSNAFRFCENLRSVTIGESVTSIGSYAFGTCIRLVEIFNYSALDIHKGTDYNQTGYIGLYALGIYTDKTKESGISFIDDFVMYYDGVTHYLVEYNGSDAEVTLPTTSYDYVVNSYAFNGLDDLINVTLPDCVIHIRSGAFNNCGNIVYNTYENGRYLGNSGNPYLVLMGVDGNADSACAINGNTKVIAGSGLYNCNWPTIEIPASVEYIGDKALYGCSKMTSIVLPDGVTSLEQGVFEKCSNLVSIEIPVSVMYLEEHALYDCGNLKTIVYKGTKEQWKAVNRAEAYWFPVGISVTVICTDGETDLWGRV